jgi:hypothetical protein
MKPQSGESRNPWYEERNKKRPLKKIMRALTNAPALGLPGMINPFFLYVHERLGAAGVLTQLLGFWHSQWPIYQSKLMQFSQAGCPACAPWQYLLSWWL